jgi:DnaJ-class molecular chaperone
MYFLAYRVLSDPERREKYDLYGIADDQGFKYLTNIESRSASPIFDIGISMKPLSMLNPVMKIHR